MQTLVDGREFIDALELILPFVAQNPMHPQLGAVRMSFEDGRLTLVATDGVTLASVSLTASSPHCTLWGGCNVSSAALRQALPWIDPKSVLWIDPPHGEVSPLGLANGTQFIANLRIIPGKFPPLKNVVPPDSEPRFSVGRKVLLAAVSKPKILVPKGCPKVIELETKPGQDVLKVYSKLTGPKYDTLVETRIPITRVEDAPEYVCSFDQERLATLLKRIPWPLLTLKQNRVRSALEISSGYVTFLLSALSPYEENTKSA